MKDQSLSVVFNSDTVIGRAAVKSAERRYYKVHKMKYEENLTKNMKLIDKISFYKNKFKFINKKKYERIILICSTFNNYKIVNGENFINDVLAVILGFSEITNKSIDNRVTLMGTVQSYDFLKLNKSKVEGKIYTTILGENTKNVRIDGSIIPIVKYLVIKR